MSDVIKNENLAKSTIAILAPSITSNDVKLTVDTEDSKIFVKLSQPKDVLDFLAEEVDFEREYEFELSKRFDVSKTSVSVKDGVVVITTDVSERIKAIEVK